jgi:hypothetical protein
MLKTKNLDRDLIELDHGQSSRREIVILNDCHSANLRNVVLRNRHIVLAVLGEA